MQMVTEGGRLPGGSGGRVELRSSGCSRKQELMMLLLLLLLLLLLVMVTHELGLSAEQRGRHGIVAAIAAQASCVKNKILLLVQRERKKSNVGTGRDGSSLKTRLKKLTSFLRITIFFENIFSLEIS